jgi:hypothetical protein
MYFCASAGLILYNGQKKGGDGDFVSLGLNNSYVEFRFDVGSGPAVIRSDHPIRTGEWHTVILSRTKKQGAGYVMKCVTNEVPCLILQESVWCNYAEYCNIVLSSVS